MNEYLLTWKTIYPFQLKSQRITITACELYKNVNDIVYRIKEKSSLTRETQRAGRDQDELALKNRNLGIGIENVFPYVYELRGKNYARMYYRKVDRKIEILGKSLKSNQQKVINILKRIYV